MEAVVYTGTCELVNTYEILEHIMGDGWTTSTLANNN